MSGSAFIEGLESRRFLSVAADIGLSDAQPVPGSLGPDLGPIAPDPVLSVPNVLRGYSGNYSLSTGLSGTFKLVIRKEQDRGDYAALRGTLDITTNSQRAIHADMTYGKIRSNNRINLTLVGTNPAVTVTVTGKVSSSGSQIKGQMDVTGGLALSTTFVINKVVHS